MKNKKRTGFVYHPDYLKHDAGPFHPESPQRLKAVVDGVKNAGLMENLVQLEPSPATVEQVEYVHTGNYVKFLQEFCSRGGGNLELDTGVSKDSYDVALLAVGGVIKAINAVLDGEVDNAFAAVRPPGHHALSDTGKGFCLFNNIAIMAMALIIPFMTIHRCFISLFINSRFIPERDAIMRRERALALDIR
jgi:acetoin utilization deacetylase AcuC-like enzyme